MRRLQRRIFGARDLPVWVQDVLGALTPIGKLNLFTTAIAIATSPERFFALTQPLVHKKRKLYATPLHFFLTSVIFLLGLKIGAAFLFPQVFPKSSLLSNLIAVPVMLAVGVLTPLWMIVLSLAALIVSVLLSPLAVSLSRAFGQTTPLLAPLDYQTYSRLHIPTFFWNLLYFSIFLFFVAPFVIGAGVVEYMTAGDGWHRMFAAFGTLVVAGFLVKPYSEVLRQSLKIPTQAILAGEVAKLKELASVPAAKVNKDAALWKNIAANITQQTERLARLERRLALRGRRYGEKWSLQLRRDLATVYGAIPKMHLEWLATWGPGTAEEREKIAAALRFIQSHFGVEAAPPPLYARQLSSCQTLLLMALIVVVEFGVVLFLSLKGLRPS